MIKLEVIAPRHCAALLAFELENADYFAQSVPRRPSEMLSLDGMAKAILALQAEMNEGVGLYMVALNGDQLVGRINFTVQGDEAEVGYRVAESATGRGIAQQMLDEGIAILLTRFHLKRIVGRAMTSNPASAHILQKAGFDPQSVEKDGGLKRGFLGDMVRYERAL